MQQPKFLSILTKNIKAKIRKQSFDERLSMYLSASLVYNFAFT